MNTTANYKLKKPEGTDLVDIQIFNDNADIIDTELAKKATKDVVTTSANGLMSYADKIKLNGVAEKANNYTHPSSHAASMITQDSSHRFVTDSEKATWNAKQNALTIDSALSSTSTNPVQNKVINSALAGKAPSNHTHNYAGSSSPGGAATSAEKCTGNSATATKATQDSAGQQINTTYIKGLSVNGRTITYTKGNGTTGTITTQDTNTTYGVATTSSNGLMSSTDKSKLDGIATGANKTIVDLALSSISTNPVQNKAVYSALAGKAPSDHTHRYLPLDGGIMVGTLTVNGLKAYTGCYFRASMLVTSGTTISISIPCHIGPGSPYSFLKDRVYLKINSEGYGSPSGEIVHSSNGSVSLKWNGSQTSLSNMGVTLSSTSSSATNTDTVLTLFVGRKSSFSNSTSVYIEYTHGITEVICS